MKKPSRVASLGPRKTRGTPQETAERLVSAAAHSFNEHGYFATDSNRIALAAGYSPGTFYKHFVDKRAVFLAAYAWWVKAVWAEVERAFDVEAADLRERAQRIVAGVVQTHRAWIGFRRDLRHLATSDAEVRSYYLERRHEQLELLLKRSSDAASAARRAPGALLLFTLERTADAIADGEAKALGVSERALMDGLVEHVTAFMEPRG